MVSRPITLVCVLFAVAAMMMPALSTAQETRSIACTPSDPTPGDGQMTLSITADTGTVQINTVTATNATPPDAGTAQAALSCVGAGPQSCTLTLAQIAAGAASWSANISDTGGGSAVNCGPYTNADGLPVELLSFEIE